MWTRIGLTRRGAGLGVLLPRQAAVVTPREDLAKFALRKQADDGGTIAVGLLLRQGEEGAEVTVGVGASYAAAVYRRCRRERSQHRARTTVVFTDRVPSIEVSVKSTECHYKLLASVSRVLVREALKAASASRHRSGARVTPRTVCSKKHLFEVCVCVGGGWRARDRCCL